MRNVDRVTAALQENSGATHSWLVGEPCFAPPPELIAAFSKAVNSSSSRYPPPAGLPELRLALAAYHSGKGQSASPDQVAVTHGAKGGLLALLATLLEPGDELIHPLPCYPAYPIMAKRLGARPIGVAENGHHFSDWIEGVESKIGPKTRAVVLSSPSNPTGTTLSSETADSLIDLCRRDGLRLISDEAYADFRFTGSEESLPSQYDPERKTVVQIRSASKSWALCGWRVGWLLAEPTLVQQVARTHASLLNPASGPAQMALCSLDHIRSTYLDEVRATVAHRATALTSALAEADQPYQSPEGGFYLWLDIARHIGAAGVADGVEWCVDCARNLGIGMWPGEDFGGPGYVRVAVTAPSEEDWQPAVAALAKALSSEY